MQPCLKLLWAAFAAVATLLFAGLALAQTAAAASDNPNDVPDYLHEAQTCSRIDLRPALVQAGFAEIRNRGGRETNESFALSEMIGLAIGQPVSARWLEHWIEDHHATAKLKVAVRAIGAGSLRACLELAVDSEDLESTRLARLRYLSERAADFPAAGPFFDLFKSDEYMRASLSPFSCRVDERTTNEKQKLDYQVSEDPALIDQALLRKHLAVIDEDAGVFAIAGRRLNPSSGRCEYLVRNYQGPTCDHPCEDGSEWIERDTVQANVHRLRFIQ